MYNDYFYNLITSQIDGAECNYSKCFTTKGISTYYRGQSNSLWGLTAGIDRLALSDKERQFIESSILAMAEKCADWIPHTSLFENIARMQHSGEYKTRFIDFTMCRDVALFFACESNKNSDGALFICHSDERTAKHDDTDLISHLARVDHRITVTKFAEEYLKEVPTSKMTIEEIVANVLSWVDYGFFVSPTEEEREELKANNPRLYKQQGAFFVLGNQITYPEQSRGSMCGNWHEVLPEHSKSIELLSISLPFGTEKIIIPKEYKNSILESLEKRGINKEKLGL